MVSPAEDLPSPNAQAALRVHCHARKYLQRANRWFGLVLRPDGILWFGLKLNFPWTQDARLDTPMSQWPTATARQMSAIGTKSARKISVNAPCPCGSGKKYKTCCMKR